MKKNKNKNVFAKAFGVFKRQGPKSATSIPSPTTPSVASPREDTLPAPTVAKPDAPSVVKVSSALELDPSLAQAIGHVPEAKSKKSPLEMDEKKGEDDFDVSDISDSSEEDNAPESPVDDTKLR